MQQPSPMHRPPPPPAVNSSGWSSLLAALTLLGVAYTNQSLIGLLFLLAFLAWGATRPAPEQRQSHGSTWAAISGLSALALLLQLGVQAAFLLGAPFVTATPVLAALEVLGFPRATSAVDVLRAVVPLLLALFASAAQVQAARSSSSRQQRQHAEGTEMQPLSQQQQWRRHRGRAHLLSGDAWGAMAATVALLAVAVVNPCVLAAPYMLVAVVAVWRWSGDIGGCALRGTRLLQTYSAVHLVVLYVWQAAFHSLSLLQPLAKLLGLFTIGAEGEEVTWRHLLLALTQLASLLVLFLTLGSSDGGRRQQLGRRGAPNATSSWEEGEQQPLLMPAHWRQELLSLLLLDAAGAGWELLSSRPAAVAALLCSTALLQPSLVGGCLLLLGLSALLLKGVAGAMQRQSQVLSAALFLWLICCYGTTIAASVIAIPEEAVAVGMLPLADAPCGPWLPLLLMLLTAAASASLAKVAHGSMSLRSSSGGTMEQYVPPRLQQLLGRLGSMRQPRITSAPGSPVASPGPTPLAAMSAGMDAAAVPWQLAWFLLLRLLWYSGFVAVPVVLFVVGAERYNILHGMYLAGLLLYFLSSSFKLKPTINQAILGCSSHWLLRWYTSLHLISLYTVYVGGLPGFNAVLQPAEQQQILSIVGLWKPLVAAGMLPLLGLLLLATFHCFGSKTVHRTAREQHCTTIDGVPTWHAAAMVYGSRLAVAYGPPTIVLLGYSLLLLDCSISLLGLCYLLLLAALLLLQPSRGYWHDPTAAPAHNGSNASSAAWGSMGSSVLPAVMRGLVQNIGTQHVVLRESRAWRWTPLFLLSACAAMDFIVQGLLPATAGYVPLDVLEFLRTVVGFDQTAQGLELAARLLRPVLLLAAVAAYRCLYCVGMLHKQLEQEAMSEAACEAKRMHAQLGWKALVKRLLILHGNKAVVVLAFACAMQHVGAVGWVFTVGAVVLVPALGAPSSGSGAQRAALYSTATLAAAWVIAQYAVIIPWLQHLLLQLSPDALDWAQWLGLLLPPPPEPGSGGGISSGAQLEHLMRVKCLLLVAVALKLKAFRWQAKLPQELRTACKYGALCPLFWPQAIDYQPPPLEAPLSPSAGRQQHGITQLSLLGSLREAGAMLLSRAQHATQQALRAVDWPAGEEGSAEEFGAGIIDSGMSQPVSPVHPRVAPAGSATVTAIATGLSRPGQRQDLQQQTPLLQQQRHRRRWRLLRFAAQDWVERAWQDLGLEACLLLLLLAAFTASNALSLFYMAAIATGMALPRWLQQALWKWLWVPILGALLVYQYSVILGPPPFVPWLPALLPGILPDIPDEVKNWLGLTYADPVAVWFLFLSYCTSVMQVHSALCPRPAQQQQQQRRRTQRAASPAGPVALDGIEWEAARAAESEPLLAREHQRGGAQLLPAGNSLPGSLRASASGPDFTAAGHSVDESLWQPLAFGAQAHWRLLDWCRYMFLRHYLDLLLVCVVGLCTLENDVVHAGYLALALFYFRARIALRAKRNSGFRWLPLYNFSVMLLTLVYQAPFQLLLPPSPSDPDSQTCSWAHMLGLFRLRPGDSLLSLGYRGALADVLLWAFIRLQTYIFSSQLYDRVMLVVKEEEEQEKRELETEVASWKHKQAAAALEESRQRAARQQRVARLKAAAAGSFAAGVDSVAQLYALLVPQKEQLAKQAKHEGGYGEDQPVARQFGSAAAPVAGSATPELHQGGLVAAAEPSTPEPLTQPQQPETVSPVLPLVAASSDMLTEYEKEVSRSLGGTNGGGGSAGSADTEQQLRQQERSWGQELPPGRQQAMPGLPAGANADATAGAAATTGPQDQRLGGRLHAWVRRHFRRVDRESYACYLLFVAAFISDCSLLNMLMPLSAFGYALVSSKPSRAYWQIVLVYCEIIIIVQYAYMLPQRLDCEFLPEDLQHTAELLGIHANPLKSLPLFLVYLATLVHTYSLATRHAAKEESRSGPGLTNARDALRSSTQSLPDAAQAWEEAGQAVPGNDLEAGTAAGSQGGDEERRGESPARENGQYSRQYLGESLGSSVSASLTRMGIGVLEASIAAWEFLLRCCTAAERSPHYVLVTLRALPQAAQAPAPAAAGKGGPPPVASSSQQWGSGQELQKRLQQILDSFRRCDIAAARERQDNQQAVALGIAASTASSGGLSLPDQQEPGASYGYGYGMQHPSFVPPDFEPPPGEGSGSGFATPAAVWPPAQSPRQAPAAAGSKQAYPDLSTCGPLRLQFVSFVVPAAAESEAGSPRAAAPTLVPAAAKPDGPADGSGGTTALFEVIPCRSSPANSSGWCSVPGWPLRSMCPARHAAATLLRYQHTAAAAAAEEHQGGEGGAPHAAAAQAEQDLQILSVEHHSRQPQDWYFGAACLDFIAFVYVALFYNKVVQGSTRSLSELTNEHVVPLRFLLTLVVLFHLMVLDRLFYTVGSALGKAVLHMGEMALYFYCCLMLFWNPVTSAGGRTHLRILLLLKCAAFALGALQLRSGYPPPASYSNGMGRHTFWFLRHITTWSAVLFQVFLALPFVYELRQVLDWACTPTTLTLMDWLKLEDINTSLFFVAWNRKMRATKRRGERQPRYLKFLQGALLFTLLLMLLWVPLLLFSSGTPTFTVPAVNTFHVNATFTAAGIDGGYGAYGMGRPGAAMHQDSSSGPTPELSAEYPVYGAGHWRQRQQWLPDGSDMPYDYVPQQFQLLCTGRDADHYWSLTPPAQQQLLDLLTTNSSSVSEGGVRLRLSWSIERDSPPPSDHGGPICQGSLSIPLAAHSRHQLAKVLRGKVDSAQLLRSDPSAGALAGKGSKHSGSPRDPGSPALYPLVWLLRGDICSSRPLSQGDIIPGRSTAPPGMRAWANQWVACNASLLPPAEGPGTEEAAGSSLTSSGHTQLAGTSAAMIAAASSTAEWWRLECWAVNATGAPIIPAQEEEHAVCGANFVGPRLVAVLERVQSGFLGQTLSKYGIAGLYTVFVYGIGRFLRLSITNIRMRIPYEDLPNTRRLVALCQDIYIARAQGELALEEELYWALINIYRLPTVMFELTKKNV